MLSFSFLIEKGTQMQTLWPLVDFQNQPIYATAGVNEIKIPLTQ
jgi:hypothetical protein